MPEGFKEAGLKGRRVLLLALCLLSAYARSAQAGLALVTGIRYDEAHRTFIIDTSGIPLVQTKRLINPDRLVVDLAESTLRPGLSLGETVQSRKIRGFRVAQFSQSPNIVRLVIELLPGVDPLVGVKQAPGHVELTLGEAPVLSGEQDLETLPPTIAPTALPTPAPVVLATPPPAPSVVPASIPRVTSRSEPAFTTQPLAIPPSPFAAPLPKVSHPDSGFGSSILLRWQQLETLDSYGAASGPVFGYPTGLNGVELRHWFLPNVGFGLDSRVLTYDLAAEGVRQNRTDLMVMPELVGRYPLLNGELEPEAFMGYMGRQVTVYSPQPGTSFPFSPSQFYHGLTVGGGGRVRLLPALSLGLSYQFLPAVGGNLFNDFGTINYGSIFPLFETRFEVELMFDIQPLFLTLGYSDETSKNRGLGYTQTLTGILAGVGYRY